MKILIELCKIALVLNFSSPVQANENEPSVDPDCAPPNVFGHTVDNELYRLASSLSASSRWVATTQDNMSPEIGLESMGETNS